jgi:hypothetical protein
MNEQERLFSEISAYYWRIRALRPYQRARRRWLYRQVGKRKAALIALGVDAEYVRLFCRFHSCLSPQSEARLDAYMAGKPSLR